MPFSIVIQPQPFDINREVELLRASNSNIGAIALFTGWVRDRNDGQRVESLYLEHYPGMAEQEIGRIVEEAGQRWPLEGVRVVHRVGELSPAEPIVLVAVASAHRAEAFAACEFIMDYLKVRAPFWKKESGAGTSRWLDARSSDQASLLKWQNPS